MIRPRKKLIEVSIPLEAINRASSREKDIKVGKHTSIHQWFAPRPLATCRAVLFSQLVDDPSSWPDRFETEQQQVIERKRLHNLIERLVQWEAYSDDATLNEARWEIARSVAWGLAEDPPNKSDSAAVLEFLRTKAPAVYDPFSGGGSIPLEAQRLGLRAYGSDLNPVAVIIGKSLIEIPPKFAGNLPINPKSRAALLRGGSWNGRKAEGLAEDVRYYGQVMRDEAEKLLVGMYPEATLPDGSKATAIAWIWARTVRSPDPSARGAMVPLASTFLLSSKEGKKAWIELVVDQDARDGYRFITKTGSIGKADEAKIKSGTKGHGRGSAFNCALTGATIGGDYIKSEGMAGRLGTRMMAIVALGKKGRVYLAPTQEHEDAAQLSDNNDRVHEARTGSLSRPVPERLTGGTCYAYGLTTFGSLFTNRQLAALTTLSDLVGHVRGIALTDAISVGMPADGARLCDGGTGADAYADAIATYLGFSINKNAQTSNSLVRWFPQGEKAQPTFERQAIPMGWDFAEANVLGSSTGGFSNCVKYVCMTLERWGGVGFGHVFQQSAQNLEFEGGGVISTDPPYYDNIAYADLSDFFFVWLKDSIGTVWPELFRRLVTPKDEELVAAAYRHGGKSGAESFFMNGMVKVMHAIRDTSNDTPISIYYAFKQSEAGQEGVTSAGWASFLQAIVDANLVIGGTWPMRTEHSSKMISQGGANVLASSVVLVCRKRPSNAPSLTRTEFVRVLKRELPAAIDEIRKAGVGPVDMQQSVIGPGMGVFSRYAKILEDDDSPMPVKTALALVNRAWAEIDQELDASFDAETQVGLAWFATFGFDARQSGELITLANAKNIGTNALFESGVFKDLKGKTALTPRDELPKTWTPATDKTLTVWECVQHTARVLNAEDGGGAAAARLVAEMGPKAADARTLAYRLFEISTQKGWAGEALIYNELAQEWPKLEDLASSTNAGPSTIAAQGDLF